MRLKDYILEADKNKVAIGHFNISDLAALRAIFESARELSLNYSSTGSEYKSGLIPVIIGVSEGEAGFIGYKQVAALVKSLREEYNYPIFLNSDHTKHIENVKRAVEAGFDAILFDAGKFSIEENIAKTKEVVEYIKNADENILVEGELGYIGSSSVILDKVPEGAAINEDDITKVEEAERFVKETGVDLLAPAVGNIHGMFKNAPNPNLFIERIGEIKNAAGVPLVLHGGSGIRDEDFIKAISAGVSIIHINTEIRLAWRKGMELALKELLNEIVPYKILPIVMNSVAQVVSERLKLFNKLK